MKCGVKVDKNANHEVVELKARILLMRMSFVQPFQGCLNFYIPPWI